MVGNWAGNANGLDGLAMVDPASETWYMRNTPSAGGVNVAPFAFGAAGWTPLAGAWTSNGKTLKSFLNASKPKNYKKNAVNSKSI